MVEKKNIIVDTRSIIKVISLCLIFIVSGCTVAPRSAPAKKVLDAQVDETVSIFKSHAPYIDTFFKNSYAYAVLPKVFKGAFFIGGAHGKGEVFENQKMVGFCSMSQATLGFSFGGEFFREVIFFKDKYDFDKFRTGEYTFSAQVTAVALSAGAAAKADYKDGLAVFVVTDTGLMVDASLGGQKFEYADQALVE